MGPLAGGDHAVSVVASEDPSSAIFDREAPSLAEHVASAVSAIETTIAGRQSCSRRTHLRGARLGASDRPARRLAAQRATTSNGLRTSRSTARRQAGTSSARLVLSPISSLSRGSSTTSSAMCLALVRLLKGPGFDKELDLGGSL